MWYVCPILVMHLPTKTSKIACRCEQPLAHSTVQKIALHCQVEDDQVVVVRDMPTIYQVPLLLSEQKLVPLLLSGLDLDAKAIPQALSAKGKEIWDAWTTVSTATYEDTVNIVLVGKYVKTPDAYMSINKSLEHASMQLRRKLNLIWIDAEHLEPKAETAEPAEYKKAWDTLKTASGLIIPGGFGKRGVLGMMLASKWARESNTPFLGVSAFISPLPVQFTDLVIGVSWFPSCSDAVCARPLRHARRRLGGVQHPGKGPRHCLYAGAGSPEYGRNYAPWTTQDHLPAGQ